MDNFYENYVTHIERKPNMMPTIVDKTIKAGCLYDNTFGNDCGRIIIDNTFINDMLNLINKINVQNNFFNTLTLISNEINNYFYSSCNSNTVNDRIKEYSIDVVKDEDGMIIGRNLSSMKEKNIAMCSEKSIATYIILENLYKSKVISFKPLLVSSYLFNEAHAFILLDNFEKEYPTKHFLFDIENPIITKDKNNKQVILIGLYSLTDEQYDAFINGKSCTPLSFYEISYPEMFCIDEKRIYGNDTVPKKL